MKSEPYVQDDRFIISAEVLNMSREERWAEIERLRAEAIKERDRIIREEQSNTEKPNAE